MISAKELKAEYIVFIENIPHHLEKIRQIMNLDKLTYSFVEIDQFKLLYELNYKTPEKLGLTYEDLVSLFYAYIGEAFMFYHGGNWKFSKMKSDEAFGTPIILNWGNDGEPHGRISPWVWKTLIERGNFRGELSGVIK